MLKVMMNETSSVDSFDCKTTSSRDACLEHEHCVWDFTGLGLDYQVLAGPTFIGVFSVSGLVFGLAADYVNRFLLLGSAVLVFSAGIMITSVSTQFWHLVMARMMLAAG